MDDELTVEAGKRALPTPTMRAALRRSAGFTQEELAGRIGCCRATLVGWEQGRDPRGALRERYAAALHALSQAA